MHFNQLNHPNLLYPNISLDSHHLWDLETSLCNRWPWWMNVCWCVTSKIFWFWFWFLLILISDRNIVQYETKTTCQLKKFYHLRTIRKAKMTLSKKININQRHKNTDTYCKILIFGGDSFWTSIQRLRITVNPLCQSLFKLSGLHGAWESTHYKVIESGVSKNQTGSNTYEVLWETSWSGQSLQCGSFQNCFWCFCQWRAISILPKSRTYVSTYISFVLTYGHGERSLLTK